MHLKCFQRLCTDWNVFADLVGCGCCLKCWSILTSIYVFWNAGLQSRWVMKLPELVQPMSLTRPLGTEHFVFLPQIQMIFLYGTMQFGHCCQLYWPTKPYHMVKWVRAHGNWGGHAYSSGGMNELMAWVGLEERHIFPILVPLLWGQNHYMRVRRLYGYSP
jgi:hypothetical protein